MRRLFLASWVFMCAALTAGPLNAAYDLPYIGDQIEYRTRYEDTFVHLARDYNLGFTEMRAANPYVDPWLPGRGTKIILPTRHILPGAPHEGIVINLAEMRLYFYPEDGSDPVTFPIGIGREGLSTPVGTTKIVRKVEGPVWRPTDRMRKEDPTLREAYYQGPDNPMGTHALYLGWPTYAIHGTNRPFGIGRRVSSGCIRMYPETIVKLFERVPVGTPVNVVNQPVKLAWIDDKLYIEVHPTLEQAVEFEERGVAPEQKLSDAEMKTLVKTAGDYEDRLNWPAIRTALKERAGYPVQIARRPSVNVKDGEMVKEEASPRSEAEGPPEETTQKELAQTTASDDPSHDSGDDSPRDSDDPESQGMSQKRPQARTAYYNQ